MSLGSLTLFATTTIPRTSSCASPRHVSPVLGGRQSFHSQAKFSFTGKVFISTPRTPSCTEAACARFVSWSFSG